MIPMIMGISIVVYVTLGISGNPIHNAFAFTSCGFNSTDLCGPALIKQLDQYFGFDKPLEIQWVNWFFHFLQADFGREIIIGSNSVTSAFLTKLVPTLEISLVPILLAVIISIPLGISAAKRTQSFIGSFILIFISINMSIPLFVLLVAFVYLLSSNLFWLPEFGRLSNQQDASLLYTQLYLHGMPLDFTLAFNGVTYLKFHYTLYLQYLIAWEKYDWLMHMIIPTICIILVSLALYTRLVRSSMLDVMKSDYILSARASGFSESTIIYKYALRNSIIPLFTILGISVGTILGGSPITETIMRWPGLGRYTIVALTNLDYFVFMAVTILVAIMLLVSNLVIDILYHVIDPRISIIDESSKK